MLVPRQQYSRELKIAAMHEIESGKGVAEVARMFQVSPKRLETWKGEWLGLALAAGVPPKVVSEQLGHASAAFTLDIYLHVLPHMQEEAAAKVEAVLMGRLPTRQAVKHSKMRCDLPVVGLRGDSPPEFPTSA